MSLAVAMSGGVDSAVAAALTAGQDRQPFGVTMRLHGSVASRPGAGGGKCCGGDDVEVARAAAAHLGIPFFVLDLEDEFRRHVIDEFVASYRAGRTPLPCARCNHDVKFTTLLRRVLGMGAELLATGHYARKGQDPASGRLTLSRARDQEKDQSYFLFGLHQEMLARLELPLGDLTKSQVREVARAARLPNADKPESQDLCFVPDGDYRHLVRQLGGPEESGEVVDEAGRVLSRHDGISRFTVGQRRGLGVGGGSGRRLYVAGIDAGRRQVTVGGRQSTGCDGLVTGAVNWISWIRPSGPRRLLVQVRHRHTPEEAVVKPLAGGGSEVIFARPVMAVAPGQAAVFYEDDLVIGGGWIESVRPVAGVLQPPQPRPAYRLPAAPASRRF